MIELFSLIWAALGPIVCLVILGLVVVAWWSMVSYDGYWARHELEKGSVIKPKSHSYYYRGIK